MQPYFLPYVGYFQLLRAADVFVLYGEAQYIKRGYVNRNRMLADGAPRWFTVPVKSGPTSDPIDERPVADERDFARWRSKWIRILEAYYRQAPHYDEVLTFCRGLVAERPTSIGELASRSVRAVVDYLGLDVAVFPSRDLDYDRDDDAEEKVIGMCTNLGARTYLNPPGGRDLYSAGAFAERNLRLAFLRPELRPYPQVGRTSSEFVPSLSILDAMMHCDRPTLTSLLDAHTIDYAD